MIVVVVTVVPSHTRRIHEVEVYQIVDTKLLQLHVTHRHREREAYTSDNDNTIMLAKTRTSSTEQRRQSSTHLQDHVCEIGAENLRVCVVLQLSLERLFCVETEALARLCTSYMVYILLT